MMEQKGIDAYRTADTMGKSQVELILKVYDGAIAAFSSALENFEIESHTEGREQIKKGRKFVTHLFTTLDPEAGGEVAENLGKLYSYVISQSYIAEATKDTELIKSNITVLQNLRSGWQELKSQQLTQIHPASAAPHTTVETAG